MIVWAAAVGGCFIIAVLLHALACRLPWGADRVTRFLITGGTLGIALLVTMTARYGLTALQTICAVLVYALLCELYIFLFTMTMSSISSNLLVRLAAGDLPAAEIDRSYDSRLMVTKRLDRLVATGFLRTSGERLELTTKGRRFVRVFGWLRGFFFPAAKRGVIEGPAAPPPAASWREQALAALVLSGIAAFLFRDHLSGAMTFLGNPDRINHSLKMLAFYVDGISRGALHAWNEAEMLGYDAYVQPYTFPNPVSYLVAAAGPENLFITAGYVSFALLALAGVAAYMFCRSMSGPLPALAGGVLYECSALTILKVSQNDMSFAVIVLIPVLALLIKRAARTTLLSTYVGISLTVFFLMQFCFVQKTAYALIFAAAYAAFLVWKRRDWRVAGVLIAAGLTGALAAAPRWIGMAAAMLEYVRIQPEWTINSFDDLFKYQGIEAYQILRWFEDGIFGKYFSDPTALSNGLNLTEGFLLYTSALVPFLVLAAMFDLRPGWKGAVLGAPNETRFLLWFMLLTFAVALVRPFNYVFHLLFLKLDFVHARFLVVGLLPLVAYVAARLESLRPDASASRWRAAVAGALIAAGLAAAIEHAATSATGHWRLEWESRELEWEVRKNVDLGASIRVAGSGIAIALLVGLSSLRAGIARATAYWALSLLLCIQAVVGANFRLNGQHTRNSDIAFRNGDLYFAPRTDFTPPSRGAREALHKRVERDDYRSVVICDAASAGGFCAGHVGQFWQLRLADGYYGIGVPARIAMLPWSSGLGLRHIIFTSLDQVPWGLLGFLNVKYALISDNALYRNRAGADPQTSPRMVPNPAHVVPRVFFAASLKPVGSAAEAKSFLFKGATPGEPEEASAVEGLDRARQMAHGGIARILSRNDSMEVRFEPGDAERFLVINELWTPLWSASIDGKDAKVYPTNIVMRGVFVPPGASTVTLTYTPTVSRPLARIWYAAAFLLFLAGAYALRRRSGALH